MIPIKLFQYFFIYILSVSIHSVNGLSKLNGTPCTGQAECDYFVEGSICNGTVCLCPENTVMSGDGSKCIFPADGYGATCTDDVQCSAILGAGGICTASTCACAASHHYRRGQCWRSVPLNGSCFEDDQCYAAFDFVGVSCQNGFCKCRQEYYEREMACRRKRNNGEDCAIDEDCCPFSNEENPKPICNNRICQCNDAPKIENPIASVVIDYTSNSVKENACPAGYFLSNTACVPEIGTSCSSSDNNCKAGVASAICIDERECGCNGTLAVRSLNNHACLKIATAFSSTICTESGQCAKFGGNSICDTVGTKKLCICAEGTHFVNNSQICHISSQIGDSCVINDDCYALSGNIECSNNVCTCKSGNHEANNRLDCRPNGLHVNDECQEDTDCLFDNAICSEAKKCDCQEHYIIKDGLCKSGIGSGCSDDKACAEVPLTSCLNATSTCECPINYVSSNDFSTCLPVVNANEKCEETDQCESSMGELKECQSGVCTCVENAQYVLGRCYLIKKLGEKCSARAECVYPGGNPDGYICQNGKCACQYGYLPNGDQCMPD